MKWTDDVMRLLNTHAMTDGRGTAGAAYGRTGTFAFELYATKPNASVVVAAAVRRDLLELRAKRDPDGIFLTKYWREHLGADR